MKKRVLLIVPHEYISGELYPCKPDIFELTYEEVTSYSSQLTGIYKKVII